MGVITILQGPPFVTVRLRANGQQLQLGRVLLDTGSAATVFRTDDLRAVGVALQPSDRVRFMSGVGGREAVVEKEIEGIEVGEFTAGPFRIQMGALDYGFSLNGILGMDYLLQVGATIDLRQLVLRRTPPDL